jgi:hypothetical protein
MGRSGQKDCGRRNPTCQRVAIDADEQSWFRPAAEKLRHLDGADLTWRTEAAGWLDKLAATWERSATLDGTEDCVVSMTIADGNLLAQVALELIAEENPRALERASVTWQTLAADDLTALSSRVRGTRVQPRAADD